MKNYNFHLDNRDVEICRKLERPILGYGMDEVASNIYSAIYLSTKDTVFKFSATHFELEDDSEYFGLSVNQLNDGWDKISYPIDWAEEQNEIFVLVRSEGLFPDGSFKDTSTIGVPRSIQKTLIEKHPYEKPISVCNVACGIRVVNSDNSQLLLYADTLPFSLCLVLGETDVQEDLKFFSQIPLEKYNY
ncbi:hypothetical protein [Sneathiella glossodoripedis]|uniref:hypothetical protein n=1 Tax=Sneathiella glossodoripedis TaxID=418853 RepID=UPI0011DE0183|nr:hypothetical protein [Sneathiella glossodoripedis]